VNEAKKARRLLTNPLRWYVDKQEEEKRAEALEIADNTLNDLWELYRINVITETIYKKARDYWLTVKKIIEKKYK
jgi:hypothetical protein